MFVGIIDKQRFSVLELMVKNQLNNKLLCSQDIEKELGLFRSSLGKILSDFVEYKIVKKIQNGKKVYYKILDIETISEFVEFCKKLSDKYE